MTLLGIGWYKKHQWEHLRRISVDTEILEPTWEEWAENAEQKVVELMSQGHNVQKVSVDVVELELWCRAGGKSCDGAARAEYVTRNIK